MTSVSGIYIYYLFECLQVIFWGKFCSFFLSSDTVKYRHLHSIDRESYIVGVVAESHVVVVVVNGEGKIKTKTTVQAPWVKADTR